MAGFTGTWQDGTVASEYQVNTPGTYALTVTDGPCTVFDSLSVGFFDLPTVDAGADQTGCAGDELTVDVATDPLNTVFWADGVSDLTRTFSLGGTYVVEVEDANGCTSTDSVTLTLRELPTIDLGPDTSVCADRSYRINARIEEGNSILWQDGSRDLSFFPREAGLVVAIVNDGLCSALDSVRVQFEICADFKVYMPSAFSPNLDGVNDGFGPNFDQLSEILEYRMEVYDRWGATVFISEDPTAEWEGTNQDGTALPTGVYIYSIALRYRDDRGEGNRQIDGDVTLLR